jgi:hypothetical protein
MTEIEAIPPENAGCGNAAGEGMTYIKCFYLAVGMFNHNPPEPLVIRLFPLTSRLFLLGFAGMKLFECYRSITMRPRAASSGIGSPMFFPTASLYVLKYASRRRLADRSAQRRFAPSAPAVFSPRRRSLSRPPPSQGYMRLVFDCHLDGAPRSLWRINFIFSKAPAFAPYSR